MIADFVAATGEARDPWGRGRGGCSPWASHDAAAPAASQDEVWMGFWRASIERDWPDRAPLAAFLRALPGTPTIYCDDATLELLSGLDRAQFDRHWIDDPRTWDLIDDEPSATREAPSPVAA